ncbi:hypothetical protein [Pedobacter sp. MW01-1-1]|uniref:hypothetical protein n=1 Tax=Pedobacter sp. MW01-1-1 TaxID=3383027 RepID=UPI003FEF4FD3
MAVKKIIYKLIGEHLTQKLNTDTNIKYPAELPALKWFDKQMGQFLNPETSYALPLPTILMEFGQISWSTSGLNTQKGEGILRFYIYFENYSDSFSGSINQDLALQFFEFTEQANLYLQGLNIPGILSALERVTDAEDIEQDMIITSVLEYSCTIFDNSTNITRNTIEVEPELNLYRNSKSSRPNENNELPFLTS